MALNICGVGLRQILRFVPDTILPRVNPVAWFVAKLCYIYGRCYIEIGDVRISTIKIATMASRFVGSSVEVHVASVKRRMKCY